MTAPPGPFDPDGFGAYNALPRLTGLALSADGTRAVVAVSAPNPAGNRFTGSLWSVDPAGRAPAARLTRSSKGESSPVFSPTGDLLFLSARPDPAAAEPPDDAPSALWLLPPAGEARAVLTRPGGVVGVGVARAAGTVVVLAPALPGSSDEAADAAAVEARRDAKVTAILHEDYPVRFWDHDLGPAANRLLVVDVAAEGPGTVRDLTGHVGSALVEAQFDVVPDGSAVVTTWATSRPDGSVHLALELLDVATGSRRTLADVAGHDLTAPRISPDGRRVAAIRERDSAPDRSARLEVVVVALADGAATVLGADWDGWPHVLRWTPDSAALVVGADFHGAAPLFRVPADGGPFSRLTDDLAAYSDVEVGPDGDVVALRSAVDAPPAPVAVSAAGAIAPLPGPAAEVALPGRLEQLTATAADGTAIRSALVLPGGASADAPAPLVLWVHGGPLSSWNAWSWRWNPWLLAARGYAVLLPDPALSTGYGQAMIDRGWGQWGGAPYTDVLAATDAALERPDLDTGRTAMMGGSYGGFMANWIAGQTDRFAAIVSHASLWNLETFGDTTDAAWYWRRELTPEAARAFSPHHHAGSITTPMLVVHGDRDYRVPIGEGLALWWALTSQAPRPADGSSAHRFLYFPDENHWVLTPNHAALWYRTVLAFLDQHVLGRPWSRPPELG